MSVYSSVSHWDRSAALQQLYHGVACTQGVFYGTIVLYPLNQPLLSFINHSQTVATPPHMLNETKTALENRHSGYNEHLSSKCTHENSS